MSINKIYRVCKHRLFVRYSLTVVACLALHCVMAQVHPQQRVKATPPNNPHKLWLFLLAGQSNMAGRGAVEPADTLPNVHVLTLNKDGEWEIAKDPIHFDRTYAGVGPGLTFGKRMAAMVDTDIYIGLIPCAVGGSSINTWLPATASAPAAKNYQQAIERCRKAMQSGELKGIIWAQGETDCTEKGVPGYDGKLMAVVNGFRTDLGNAQLPFINAELPAFQLQQRDASHQLRDNPYVLQINQLIKSLKGKANNYDYITSEGTDHRGDHLHYNTASARLMGERYAALMKKMLRLK